MPETPLWYIASALGRLHPDDVRLVSPEHSGKQDSNNVGETRDFSHLHEQELGGSAGAKRASTMALTPDKTTATQAEPPVRVAAGQNDRQETVQTPVLSAPAVGDASSAEKGSHIVD